MLPLEVLQRAEKELLCYGESGMSVMEMSHRSADFEAIVRTAEASLRKLMNLPSNYKVLFLQGGATTQFAAVPLNLLSDHKCADYIVSGQFSEKAAKEAKKYGDIAIAASSAGANPTFSIVPETDKSSFRLDADYVHICFNNTIYGTKFHYIPETGNIPLVADVSSCILSEPIEVSKFGLLYGAAQKNIGPAGLTIVIVREDLIGKARSDTPATLDYKIMADNGSIYNTPPCYSIYMANLVFEWILDMGGLEGLFGIPGTVGGMVRQNAGAFGYEVKDRFVLARCYFPDTGDIAELSPRDMEFTYRGSILSRKGAILLCATFDFIYKKRDEILREIREYRDKRLLTQPLDKPSLGSVFKRHQGVGAGYYIDKLGLKGFSIGGACVSDKHAGFIINTGGATADDYLKLVDYVKSAVYSAFGIELEEEIEII